MNEEIERLTVGDFEKAIEQFSAEHEFRSRQDDIRMAIETLTEIFQPIIENAKILFGWLIASNDNDYDGWLAMLKKEEEHTKRMRLEEMKDYRQDFGNIAHTKGKKFKSQVQLNKPKFIQARSRL